MIIPEKELNSEKINGLIGKKISSGLRKQQAIGSSSFLLKSFVNKTDQFDTLITNSKCNFEKRPKGILLYANYSNKLNLIPIPESELIKIELIKGEELIRPFPFSPMWILLKLGVSIFYAKYFRLWSFEYSISQMYLNIFTTKYDIQLTGNGFMFENQKKFFQSLNYGHILEIVS